MAAHAYMPLDTRPGKGRLRPDPGVADFPCSPHAPALRLPNAGEFSRDREMKRLIGMLTAIKAQPELMKELMNGFGLDYGKQAEGTLPREPKLGTPPIEGNYALLMLAFAATIFTSLQAFHDFIWEYDKIWIVCGFQPNGPDTSPPSYHTVRNQFIALEKQIHPDQPSGDAQGAKSSGYHRAKVWLQRRAREAEPMVGRSMHYDGTAVATHSALIHRCPLGTSCGETQDARAAARRRAHRKETVPARLRRGAKAQLASASEFNSDRHQEVDSEEWTGDKVYSASGMTRLTDEQITELRLEADVEKKPGQGILYAWWSKEDDDGVTHYFCCLDRTVGARKLRGKGGGKGKFYIGWNHDKAVCAFTGLTVDYELFQADINEHIPYATLTETVRDSLGVYPQHMTADKALTIKSIYEFNSARGIGSALPWNGPPQIKERGDLESDVADRHGVPRCQHCGAEGHTRGSGRGFRVTEHGTPMIRFSCTAKLTAACRKIQTLACSEEPRLLQPLQVRDQVYGQLRHYQNNREGLHHHDRQRHGLSGKEAASRAYRKGIGWQKLRIEAALVLDWFHVCERHGWLGSLRHATNFPETYETLDDGGRMRSVLRAREACQLALPYGPKAADALFGFRDPPWITKPPPKKR